MALFPSDRPVPPMDCAVVQIRLALSLWSQLRLDDFWSPRLPPSRKGTCWLNVLKTLVCYRLIDPGSEWHLRIEVDLGQLLRRDAGSLEVSPSTWDRRAGSRSTWSSKHAQKAA